MTIVFVPIRDFFTGSELDFCPLSEPNCPEKPGKLGNLDILNTRDSPGVFKNLGCPSWKSWKIRRSARSKKGKSRAERSSSGPCPGLPARPGPQDPIEPFRPVLEFPNDMAKKAAPKAAQGKAVPAPAT
ncbi:MAG TPA: hypothetical protein VKP69_09650, partial [Isosphaeraceae bacterium]|nr:hypothetical protein [Isosphaeraceae bacterium]